MEQAIEKFKQLIKNKIIDYDNLLKNNSDDYDSNKIKIILNKIKNSDLWNLNVDDLNELKKFDEKYKILLENELIFLTFFVKIPSVTKEKLKIRQFNFNQRELIDNIYNKFAQKIIDLENKSKVKNNEIVNIIDQMQDLLKKLNETGIMLIKDNDLINSLLDNDIFSFDEKISIYKKINQINFNLFKNYTDSNVSFDDEEILSEDELKENEVPLSEDQLRELFEKYQINWFNNNDEAYKIYIEKLLKLGDLDKINSKLEFISNNRDYCDLRFIKEYPEILYNILLYSDIDKVIKKNLDGLKDVGINTEEQYSRFIKKAPMILYPLVYNPHKSGKKSTNKSEKKYNSSRVSGVSKGMIQTLKLLYERKFDAIDVIDKCPSVLSFSPKTVEKAIKSLESYDIYLNGEKDKRTLSCLQKSNISTLDIAIETGFYQYLNDNKSKIPYSDISLYYKGKLLRKNNSLFLKENSIFRIFKNNKRVLNGDFVDYFDDNKTSMSKEDIFKSYNALDLYNPYFSEILENSNLEFVPQDIQNDLFIKKLDSKYMADIVIDKNTLEEKYMNGDNYDGETHKNLVYIFNNNGKEVIISRNKVLRIYNALFENVDFKNQNIDRMQVLMYSITYLSMLDQEEYDIIKNEVNNLFLEKKERIKK